jgi:deazaflavin-dependent oxidoreductase (nitroreductase family)
MQFPSPPRGIKSLPWRLPILLYKVGLGWVLGSRFLLLRHRGRKSGKERTAVLEIIHSSSEIGCYYVVSGFGTRSDWYQNILQDNHVEIQVGSKRFPAQADQLDPAEGAEVLTTYAQKHPGSLQALSKLMGYEFEFTPQGIQDFGRQIPVIQFTSRSQTLEKVY